VGRQQTNILSIHKLVTAVVELFLAASPFCILVLISRSGGQLFLTAWILGSLFKYFYLIPKLHLCFLSAGMARRGISELC
jgi:hypothetical protein